MDLFTYLMAKKGNNTQRDLFSYLLGKGSGGGGTYTTYTGTSLNIASTLRAKIKNFMLNSTELTQDGTPTPDNPVDVNVITGENNVKVGNKNLFKPYTNDGSVTSNGVVYTMNNDNTITINGTVTGNTWVEILENFRASVQSSTTKYLSLDSTKTYTIKANIISGTYTGQATFYTQINSSGGEVYSNLNNSSSITNSDGLYRAWFRVFSGDVFDNLKIGIQLEEGSTATEYVEHQEQNYPITLSSKNLFNINGDVNTRYNGQTGNYNSVENNNLTTTYSTNVGYSYGQRIYVGAGKKVTISSVVTDINSTGSKSAIIMCFNDNTATGVQSVAFDNTEINTRKSFSFVPDTDYIIVTFAGRYNGFVSATFTDIQVEYGETATTYEPYYNIEYCKIGNYADQIFKNTTNSPYYDNTLIENEWYLKKNIGKVILDGSENWAEYPSQTSDGYRAYTDSVKIGLTSSLSYDSFLSDYFQHIAYATKNSINLTKNATYLNIDNTIVNSISNLKDWLSSHNTVIYYQAENPTYIHISQEDYSLLKGQLDNLYTNAESYDEQTNITQTNDDLPFNISVNVKVKDV